MQGQSKKILILAGLTVLTLVLGGVAVMTALKLKQFANVPVAPNVPQSQPLAQTAPSATPTQPPANACIASFTVPLRVCNESCNTDTDCGKTGSTQLKCISNKCLNEACQTNTTCICGENPTPSPTPSSTPTPSPTPTNAPTATPIPPGECSKSCGSNSDCVSGLVCSDGRCLNNSCLGENDCVCPSPTPGPTNTPAPGSENHGTTNVGPTQPALPNSGSSTASVGLLGAGGMLLILGVVAALLW